MQISSRSMIPTTNFRPKPNRKTYKEREKTLEQLPLQFREVVILYELEGLSYKELASTLGVPVGTVMSRLSRARRRLRERSDWGGIEHEL